LIEENHLGYTFESENVESLATVLKEALLQSITVDKKYNCYRQGLNPEKFIRSYCELYEELSNYSEGRSKGL